MGEISNKNIAFIENQEKVTEKQPMSPSFTLSPVMVDFMAYV